MSMMRDVAKRPPCPLVKGGQSGNDARCLKSVNLTADITLTE